MTCLRGATWPSGARPTSEARPRPRHWRTANGLRLGDSVARARELFPMAALRGRELRLIVRKTQIGTIVALAAWTARGRVAAFEVAHPSGGE